MEQKASELFAEFEALVDFLSSGNEPQQSDRNNAFALWGKMRVKLDSGPIPSEVRFEQNRIMKSIKQSHATERGKELRVTFFEKDLDAMMEEGEPNCLQTHIEAKRLIERLLGCIEFLQEWLRATNPSKKTLGSMSPEDIRSVMGTTKGARAPRKPKDTAAMPVPDLPAAPPRFATPGVGFETDAEPVLPATPTKPKRPPEPFTELNKQYPRAVKALDPDIVPSDPDADPDALGTEDKPRSHFQRLLGIKP